MRPRRSNLIRDLQEGLLSPDTTDHYDRTPTTDVPETVPYLIGLTPDLIIRAAGLLHALGASYSDATANIAGLHNPDSPADPDQQAAALQVAIELRRALSFQIIGADDADPDPTLTKSKIVVYPPGDSGAPVGLPGADYIVQYHPKLIDTSSFILISFAPTVHTDTYDLTALGTIDWYKTGPGADHKSAVTRLIANPAGQQGVWFSATTNPLFSWTDGTSRGSATDSGGIYSTAGAPLTQSITCEAHTPYRLYLHVGADHNSPVLTATFADGSKTAINSDYVSPTVQGSGVYTIDYQSASNTTLNLSYAAPTSGYGFVAMAIAPSTAVPPAPAGSTIISLTGLDDTPVLSVNGGFHAIDRPGGYDLQRVQPVADVNVSLNGIAGTNTDSIPGGATQPQRNIALAYTPPVVPVTPPAPCNCDTGGSKPPPTPPPTPPPDIPTPTPPVKQSWDCANVIDDAGVGIAVTVAGVVGVGAKYYDQNNTAVAAAITTILGAEISPALQAGDIVQSLDMRCDAVMQISPFSLIGAADPIVSRPVIRKIDGDSTIDYYYFVRARTDKLFPGPLIHDVYDGHPETVTVGPLGYNDWVIDVAYFECEIARAFTDFRVRLCGALVKYWESLFFYPFDGTEQVLADGMHDKYDNYVTPFDTGAFLGPDGYSITTDQVHGFDIRFTPIADAVLRGAKTTAIIAGHIKSIPGGENNDTNFYLSIVSGSTTVVVSAGQSLLHTDDKDFSFTVTGTFDVGTEYIFSLHSDSFANGQYYLTNLRGALT